MPGAGRRLAALGLALLGLAASAAGGAWLTGCAINPATGSRQINFVSESSEVKMGREADRAIMGEYGAYDDTALVAFVEEVGQKLAAVSERPELEWHFRLLDSPVVNAFAIPGGYVYITRGILAAMNSEAQLAGVIGHEIGHVTARHTAQQITQSQLATVGLVAGMIAVPGMGQYGLVAQQGLQVLFLKFSRDHENQADELGIRYAVRAGYDPRQIPSTYDMLRRLSDREGYGGLPTWQNTHPDPGDRKARTSTLAFEAALLHRDRTLAVDEPGMKRRLAGLVYGEDPEQGYLVDNRFYHPGMGFQVDWPNGWGVMNTPSSVSAIAHDSGALITLTLADRGDGPVNPAAHIDWMVKTGRLASVRGSAQKINGWDAWVGEAVLGGARRGNGPAGAGAPRAPDGNDEPGSADPGDADPGDNNGDGPSPIGGNRRGGAAHHGWLALVARREGGFYQFTGMTDAPGPDGRFTNTVASFGPIRDPNRPLRMRQVVRLVPAPGNMTIEQFVGGLKDAAVPADEIGWLNNFYLKDTPPEGRLLKVIVKVPATQSAARGAAPGSG